jgi:hypothetical protein
MHTVAVYCLKVAHISPQGAVARGVMQFELGPKKAQLLDLRQKRRDPDAACEAILAVKGACEVKK